LDVGPVPKLRVPSAQSIQSRISDSDGGEVLDYYPPQSPLVESIPENGLGLVPTMTGSTVRVDVACQRPGEDVSAVDDGPVFRATMKAMELKNANMRARWKKVLKSAEAACDAQKTCNDAISGLMQSLKEASSSNANAVQPAIDHFFLTIAKEIQAYERQNTVNIQKMIIEPVTKLYNNDIKQAEAKKKDFEEESREYYAYVGKYLGQRSDSLKDKKRAETDSKYQSKRRNFELKRFDYSSFMQDLHGGRKDQEVLSHLTRFAGAQTGAYLDTAKRIEGMKPQLDALESEVKEADYEFQMQRTEREERRRELEKGTTYLEPDSAAVRPTQALSPSNPNGLRALGSSESAPRSVSTTLKPAPSTPGVLSPPQSATIPDAGSLKRSGAVSGNQSSLPPNSPSNNRFKGFRDLEEKDHSAAGSGAAETPLHKEGLLWALSRPGSHVDPKGLNKQAWHK